MRGSEADICEWDFTPFEPGFMCYKPVLKRTPHMISRKSKTSAPCRVNPVIIDLSRCIPSYNKRLLYGPGALTFAVKNRVSAHLEIPSNSNNSNVIDVSGTTRDLIAKHAVNLFQKATETNFSVRISVEEDPGHIHKGLGTTSTLFTQIIVGLNRMFDNPISNEELAKLVSLNYAEEMNKTQLMPALTTGGAFWNALLGGINIIGGDYQLVYHSEVPTEWKAMILFPSTVELSQSYSEHPEVYVMDVVRRCDRFDAGKTAYWILMEMIPAINEKNLAKIGEIVWYTHINTIKPFPPMLRLGLNKTFEMLNKLHDHYGIEVSLVSSAGPAVVAIGTESKVTATYKELAADNNWRVFLTELDNQGLTWSPS